MTWPVRGLGGGRRGAAPPQATEAKDDWMKIHFCDLCNESVPQADLDAGRAFFRKGRVVCAACDRAMSLHEAGATDPMQTGFAAQTEEGMSEPEDIVLPSFVETPNPYFATEPPPALSSQPAYHPAPAHPVHVHRGGSGGVWLALLGLVFTAGAVFVLDGRIQESERRAMETTRALEDRTQELAALRRRATELADGQTDVDRRMLQRMADEKAKREALNAELAKIQAENTELRGQITTLQGSFAALEQRSGSGSFDLEKRFAALSARVAHNEDEARNLTDKIATIESAPPLVSEAAAAPAGPGAATEAPWHLQLAGLKSDKNSTRWEAVTALGATKDPETVPFLTPMLKDTDLFVRMATARVLGDMQSKPAVPALIDALEDTESAVREAVNLALRAITNKDFKFDPLAIEAERARRVKAWRDWWKKESDSPSGL